MWHAINLVVVTKYIFYIQEYKQNPTGLKRNRFKPQAM